MGWYVNQVCLGTLRKVPKLASNGHFPQNLGLKFNISGCGCYDPLMRSTLYTSFGSHFEKRLPLRKNLQPKFVNCNPIWVQTWTFPVWKIIFSELVTVITGNEIRLGGRYCIVSVFSPFLAFFVACNQSTANGGSYCLHRFLVSRICFKDCFEIFAEKNWYEG